MLYKIIKITDLNVKDKTTEDYINRVGRITKVINAEDGVIIYTENSIYLLVEKDIAECYGKLEQELSKMVIKNLDFDEDGNPIIKDNTK